ncbi:MAG: HU family DNA-binding protein [Planctomycetota bacterium]|jgi:nucleoid DNA-binding protein
MTKNDIVLHIAERMDMRQTDIKKIVQMLLDDIIDILEKNGRLELRNFGVFEVKKRKARKARNPKTGEIVMVPACNAVTFKAGKRMEEIVSDIKIFSSQENNKTIDQHQNDLPAGITAL